MAETEQITTKEDKWIPTQCGMCYAACGIRARRIDGVAVKLEGNPDSWMGARGGMCGKGVAGLQLLYDPNRLNVPLRRTNPKKGIHEDPKWKEISWDEALDEISSSLKRLLEDDPRKIMLQGTTIRSQTNAYGFKMPLLASLSTEKGRPNHWSSGGAIHCGNGAHLVAGMVHASWSVVPDFNLCNYAIYFGASKGHGAGHSAAANMRLAAEARARGMKLVVFDPMCNFSGGKAREWIPIIPGTDAAVALAMANVILNDLGIWDAPFLKTKTNGPYLIGPDKRYMRGKETGKPLIWDPVDKKSKTYDDHEIKDFSLEGEFEVNGKKCQPAFQLLKNHLKKYSPEMAQGVSGVSAGTIQRIAQEFSEAAKVGSTITIEGVTLPYRPVSAVLFRGGEGHINSAHTCFAVSLLNQIVGSGDVPGGTLGWPPRCLGYPDTGRPSFSPVQGPDGFLSTKQWLIAGHAPWPIEEPQFPKKLGLEDLFTMCSLSPVYGCADQEDLWQKFKIPYRTEMLISHGCNVIMSAANPEVVGEAFRKIPFIVVFELFRNEFTDGFADIVLPDACYLESFTWLEGLGFFFNYPYGKEPWCYHIIQPVVPLKSKRRYIGEVLFDLIDRIGRRAQLNEFWNNFFKFEGEYRLKPDEKITWEELGDKSLKWMFGPEHGLEWFKEHGFMSWPKKIEEVYWRPYVNARVPLYLEFLIDLGDKIREICEPAGIQMNWDQFSPLMEWYPCPPHKITDEYFDLYCFSYRDIMHTGSTTMEIPWIDEASQMNPYTYNVTMNTEAGKKRGLKDGDIILIESVDGRTVKGTLKLMEGQHPKTVAIAACSGHWAEGMPIAKGKGTSFDTLLEMDFKRVDPISLNIETCIKVRVFKEGQR